MDSINNFFYKVQMCILRYVSRFLLLNHQTQKRELFKEFFFFGGLSVLYTRIFKDFFQGDKLINLDFQRIFPRNGTIRLINMFFLIFFSQRSLDPKTWIFDFFFKNYQSHKPGFIISFFFLNHQTHNFRMFFKDH